LLVRDVVEGCMVAVLIG
jgi:hypothetical protein